MADSEPAKNGRPKNAVIAGEKGIQRGPADKEVQPMEETIPFPSTPSSVGIQFDTILDVGLLSRRRQ
jgi:hypothetical protein